MASDNSETRKLVQAETNEQKASSIQSDQPNLADTNHPEQNLISKIRGEKKLIFI